MFSVNPTMTLLLRVLFTDLMGWNCSRTFDRAMSNTKTSSIHRRQCCDPSSVDGIQGHLVGQAHPFLQHVDQAAQLADHGVQWRDEDKQTRADVAHGPSYKQEHHEPVEAVEVFHSPHLEIMCFLHAGVHLESQQQSGGKYNIGSIHAIIWVINK